MRLAAPALQFRVALWRRVGVLIVALAMIVMCWIVAVPWVLAHDFGRLAVLFLPCTSFLVYAVVFCLRYKIDLYADHVEVRMFTSNRCYFDDITTITIFSGLLTLHTVDRDIRVENIFGRQAKFAILRQIATVKRVAVNGPDKERDALLIASGIDPANAT